MSADPYHVLILSEWMPNGNVMQYAGSNVEVNRLWIVSPFVVPHDLCSLINGLSSSLRLCL